MDKTGIRAEMRAKRKAVTALARVAASHEVCTRIQDRAEVCVAIANGNPIAVYLATSDEIDLAEFIVAALAQGARVAAPRWTGTDYELAVVTGLDGLVAGPHGILEPPSEEATVPAREPAVWLVPGLAFTRDGRRVGYGGGWYDRLLAAADPRSVKLGVGYDFQILDDLPVESHDVRLLAVV